MARAHWLFLGAISCGHNSPEKRQSGHPSARLSQCRSDGSRRLGLVRLGADLALASGPVAAVVQGILSVGIYLIIATVLLPL